MTRLHGRHSREHSLYPPAVIHIFRRLLKGRRALRTKYCSDMLVGSEQRAPLRKSLCYLWNMVKPTQNSDAGSDLDHAGVCALADGPVEMKSAVNIHSVAPLIPLCVL